MSTFAIHRSKTSISPLLQRRRRDHARTDYRERCGRSGDGRDNPWVLCITAATFCCRSPSHSSLPLPSTLRLTGVNRLGLPRVVSTSLVMLTLRVRSYGLAVVHGGRVRSLAVELPTYQSTVLTKLADLREEPEGNRNL